MFIVMSWIVFGLGVVDIILSHVPAVPTGNVRQGMALIVVSQCIVKSEQAVWLLLSLA